MSLSSSKVGDFSWDSIEWPGSLVGLSCCGWMLMHNPRFAPLMCSFFLTVELAHVFFCFHTYIVHSRSVCFVSCPEPLCCAFKMFWRVFCWFRVSSSSIQCQLSISSKWQRSIQHLHIPALISTQTPRPVTVPSSSHFFLQVYTDTGYKYKHKVCYGKTPCLGASFVLIVQNVYSRICLIEYLGIFHVLWTSLYFSIAIM